MEEDREHSGGRGASGGGRMLLAFSSGAFVVSVLALAFSLGRHWPLREPVKTESTVPSLPEAKLRNPIPYSELAIDRGTESDITLPPSAAADAQDRVRTTGNHP